MRPDSRRASAPVDRLLQQRLIICLGNGGVGKTTVAAALALAAAEQHRKTAVITVDPSRRLRDTLGLDTLSVDPHRIPLSDGIGHLDALALDAKRTFDALIARLARNPEIANRIYANRLYRELSNEFGGSIEYMAMEKLHELLHQHMYQLVVVDTPPSADARDLLSAPLRITALLASSAVRILKTPASLLWGSYTPIGRLTMTALLKGLERWTGLSLLQDLADFATNFEQLADGFRARAEDIDQALRSGDTSFVLVTTPEPDTVAATIEFDRELRAAGFPVAGVIANRVHDFPPPTDYAGLAYPEGLRRKLLSNYSDFVALAERDGSALARLHNEMTTPLLMALPTFEEAPTSFAGLSRMAALLRAPSQRPRPVQS